jgi:hypothetical protein
MPSGTVHQSSSTCAEGIIHPFNTTTCSAGLVLGPLGYHSPNSQCFGTDIVNYIYLMLSPVLLDWCKVPEGIIHPIVNASTLTYQRI